MATYKIYATKTIELEATVEAETEFDAWKESDELITDDFDEKWTSFKIDAVILETT